MARPGAKVGPRRVLGAIRYLLRLRPVDAIVFAPGDKYLLVILAKRQDNRSCSVVDDRAGVAAGAVAIGDDRQAGVPGPSAVVAAAQEDIDLVVVLSGVAARFAECQDGAPAGDCQRGDPVLAVPTLAGDEEIDPIQWCLCYRGLSVVQRAKLSCPIEVSRHRTAGAVVGRSGSVKISHRQSWHVLYTRSGPSSSRPAEASAWCHGLRSDVVPCRIRGDHFGVLVDVSAQAAQE